ncbi:MAG TPA: hypothetical protein DCX27_07565, partial [Balneola sp.]|nr:hypothetical protein [Balneola sp.]
SFTSNNYLTNIFASNNYVTANLGGGGSSANVISVFDTVSGCPPSRAAGTSIMRIDFTLAEGAFFKVHYQIIATHTARIDHYLVIDGTTQGMALTDTNNAGWKPVNLFYGGYLPAGSHYTYITASVASKTGCGSMWGRGYLTIYE